MALTCDAYAMTDTYTSSPTQPDESLLHDFELIAGATMPWVGNAKRKKASVRIGRSGGGAAV